MPVQQLDDIFNAGADVLGTVQDANGTILAQTGDVVAETVAGDGGEWWQQEGFVSRPADADSGSAACQAVTLNRGTFDVVIATRDLRGTRPQVAPGETCVYARGPHYQGPTKLLLQDDGTTQTATLTVGSTQIVVKSDGSVTISASAVNLAGATDFAAMAGKTDSNFDTIAAAFAAATPGPMEPGLAALKAALSSTPPSVAASQVKIG